MRVLLRTLAVLAVVLYAQTAVVQVPVEIAPPADTAARAYADALKQAPINSPTFVLEAHASTSRRLCVSVVVGGGVVLEGGAHIRGVALLLTVGPSGADRSLMALVDVYKVGYEEEGARHHLLALQQAAVPLASVDLAQRLRSARARNRGLLLVSPDALDL